MFRGQAQGVRRPVPTSLWKYNPIKEQNKAWLTTRTVHEISQTLADHFTHYKMKLWGVSFTTMQTSYAMPVYCKPSRHVFTILKRFVIIPQGKQGFYWWERVSPLDHNKVFRWQSLETRTVGYHRMSAEVCLYGTCWTGQNQQSETNVRTFCLRESLFYHILYKF